MEPKTTTLYVGSDGYFYSDSALAHKVTSLTGDYAGSENASQIAFDISNVSANFVFCYANFARCDNNIFRFVTDGSGSARTLPSNLIMNWVNGTNSLSLQFVSSDGSVAFQTSSMDYVVGNAPDPSSANPNISVSEYSYLLQVIESTRASNLGTLSDLSSLDDYHTEALQGSYFFSYQRSLWILFVTADDSLLLAYQNMVTAYPDGSIVMQTRQFDSSAWGAWAQSATAGIYSAGNIGSIQSFYASLSVGTGLYKGNLLTSFPPFPIGPFTALYISASAVGTITTKTISMTSGGMTRLCKLTYNTTGSVYAFSSSAADNLNKPANEINTTNTGANYIAAQPTAQASLLGLDAQAKTNADNAASKVSKSGDTVMGPLVMESDLTMDIGTKIHLQPDTDSSDATLDIYADDFNYMVANNYPLIVMSDGKEYVFRSSPSGDVLTSAQIGTASGICPLDSTSKVPSANLPSYVDDVLETYIVGTAYTAGWLSLTNGGPALTPEAGKIYVILANNDTYRWSGSTYVQVSTPLLTSVTYASLVSLQSANSLIAGSYYRITDFLTSVNYANAQSAGHPFDLIVRADSSNSLNEEAWAALHSGDAYFASCDLSAWKIKYSLANDTTRFAWASTSGKGVIYYLKDEFENEAYCDFKNVQYLGSSLFNYSGLGLTAGSYYFTFTTDVSVLTDSSLSGLGNGIGRNRVMLPIIQGPKAYFLPFSACVGLDITKNELAVANTLGSFCCSNKITEPYVSLPSNSIKNEINGSFLKASSAVSNAKVDNAVSGASSSNSMDIYLSALPSGVQATLSASSNGGFVWHWKDSQNHAASYYVSSAADATWKKGYKDYPAGEATGTNSVASGAGSTASGVYSTASGVFSTASGTGSTASGTGSTASGSGSTASGTGSTASGTDSVASGAGSTASGTGSGAFSSYSKVYVPFWISFDGLNAATPTTKILSLYTTDSIFFRNEAVDPAKVTQGAYLSGKTLTQVLAQQKQNLSLTDVSVDLASIIAGTNSYFDKISGDGTTASTAYLIKPKTGVDFSGTRFTFSVSSQPSASVYLYMMGRGSQSVKFLISKTIDTSGWTNHYYFNLLDHAGVKRKRITSTSVSPTAVYSNDWFTTAAAAGYYSSFDVNSDEMYATCATVDKVF